MKASYRGNTGDFAGTVGVFFSEGNGKSDRKLTTWRLFAERLARTLNRVRGDRALVKVADDAQYEANGTLLVAVDDSFVVRFGYHRIHEPTVPWLTCRNVLLEVEKYAPAH